MSGLAMAAGVQDMLAYLGRQLAANWFGVVAPFLGGVVGVWLAHWP